MSVLNKYKIFLIGVGIILAVTGYTYSIEALTDRGYKSPQIMIYRGSIALVFGIVISIFKRYSLIPITWKPQIIRFFVIGTASYFSIVSFKYLSASTVALINRLDIPFLIFFSIFLGKPKSNLQFWLSLWTVIIITFLAVDARFIDEEVIGFVYAFGSIILISIGYLLVQSSSNSENAFLLCNVFSLSNIIIGFTILFVERLNLSLNIKDVWILIVSGLSQILMYALTIALYRWVDIERARLPSVLAVFIIMILEMILEHKLFSISQIGLTIIIIGLLTTIILNPKTPALKNINNDNTDKVKNGR